MSIDYDGELARTYDAGRGISAEAARTWRAAVEPWLHDVSSIADVGAGSGRYAELLVDIVASVVCVEPAHGMRDAASRLGRRRRSGWVAAPAEALPMCNGAVDAVWSAFTMHYFDVDRAAAEFARVIRPAGRALIWHCFPEVFDRLEWLRWFPSARQIDEQRIPTQAAVVAAFEALGFRTVEQSIHDNFIEPDLKSLAHRLSHRSISTLRLIDDEEFYRGLELLWAHAETVEPAPVYTPNVLLVFERF